MILRNLIVILFASLCIGHTTLGADDDSVWHWEKVKARVPELRSVKGAGEFRKPARILEREPRQVSSDTGGIVIIAAVVEPNGRVAVAVPVKKLSQAADAAAARAVLKISLQAMYGWRPAGTMRILASGTGPAEDALTIPCLLRSLGGCRLTSGCTGHEPRVAVSQLYTIRRAVRAGEPQER